MANKFLSKKIIIPAAILFGGVLIAAGVLGLANFGSEPEFAVAQSPQWTQGVGAGIAAPACAGSSVLLNTCAGGAPLIRISIEPTCEYSETFYHLLIFLSGVSGDSATDAFRTCGDTSEWSANQPKPLNNGAILITPESNRTYNWEVWDTNTIVHATGSFNTPDCAPPPPPPPTCGNGTPEDGEACDAGGANGSCPATCSTSCTINDCGGGNQPPVAAAAISKDDITYLKSITVTQGVPTAIYLGAGASSDPDGWTNLTKGVSNGGRCDWNSDLNQGAPTFETTINNPSSSSACSLRPIPGSPITFNDPPGIYTYSVLRITDGPGAVSNVDTVSVTVSAPPDLIIRPGGITPVGGFPLVVGTSRSFWANVENIGAGSAGISTARYWVDGGFLGDVSTDPVSAGSIISVSDGFWTVAAGDHIVRVCADYVPPPNGVVGESNEGNNCLEQTFTVSPPPPGDFNLSVGGGLACNLVPLSWTASASADGYRILRESPRVDLTPYNPYTALNFTDTTVNQNTSYLYQIEAYNTAGTNRSNALNVDTPFCPPTLNFSGNPTSIFQGQSTTLTWATTFATSCVASGGWSGSKAVNGGEVVVPLPPPSVTYTLACTGPGGSTGPQSVVIDIAPLALPEWKEIIPR